MSADRLINMFLMQVKNANEGKLPEPLYVIASVNGGMAFGKFVRLHEGNDVLELIGLRSGNPAMIRTSSINVIEQLPKDDAESLMP